MPLSQIWNAIEKQHWCHLYYEIYDMPWWAKHIRRDCKLGNEHIFNRLYVWKERQHLLNSYTKLRKQGLLLETLDSKPRGSRYRSTVWEQGRPSLSFFHQGRRNKYEELLGALWLKVNCLLLVDLQPCDSCTLTIKRVQKILLTLGKLKKSTWGIEKIW